MGRRRPVKRRQIRPISPSTRSVRSRGIVKSRRKNFVRLKIRDDQTDGRLKDVRSDVSNRDAANFDTSHNRKHLTGILELKGEIRDDETLAEFLRTLKKRKKFAKRKDPRKEIPTETDRNGFKSKCTGIWTKETEEDSTFGNLNSSAPKPTEGRRSYDLETRLNDVLIRNTVNQTRKRKEVHNQSHVDVPDRMEGYKNEVSEDNFPEKQTYGSDNDQIQTNTNSDGETNVQARNTYRRSEEMHRETENDLFCASSKGPIKKPTLCIKSNYESQTTEESSHEVQNDCTLVSKNLKQCAKFSTPEEPKPTDLHLQDEYFESEECGKDPTEKFPSGDFCNGEFSTGNSGFLLTDDKVVTLVDDTEDRPVIRDNDEENQVKQKPRVSALGKNKADEIEFPSISNIAHDNSKDKSQVESSVKEAEKISQTGNIEQENFKCSNKQSPLSPAAKKSILESSDFRLAFMELRKSSAGSNPCQTPIVSQPATSQSNMYLTSPDFPLKPSLSSTTTVRESETVDVKQDMPEVTDGEPARFPSKRESTSPGIQKSILEESDDGQSILEKSDHRQSSIKFSADFQSDEPASADIVPKNRNLPIYPSHHRAPSKHRQSFTFDYSKYEHSAVRPQSNRQRILLGINQQSRLTEEPVYQKCPGILPLSRIEHNNCSMNDDSVRKTTSTQKGTVQPPTVMEKVPSNIPTVKAILRPPPAKGALKDPSYCPKACTCELCVFVKERAKNAIIFSRRQMANTNRTVNALRYELSSMRCLIRDILNSPTTKNSNEPPSEQNTLKEPTTEELRQAIPPEWLARAIDCAKAKEEQTRKSLDLMTQQCVRFCELLHNTPVPRPKKATFADHLCRLHNYELAKEAESPGPDHTQSIL